VESSTIFDASVYSRKHLLSQVSSRKSSMFLVPFEIQSQWGGGGGKPFCSILAKKDRLRKVRLYEGRYLIWKVVAGIELSYDSSSEVERFGTCQGLSCEMRLQQDEVITMIHGRCGAYVDFLKLKTNHGRTVECGGEGGKEFVYRAPENTFVNGFHGAAGAVIDRIGVILLAPSTFQP
jgi:hypothetical protein